MREYRLRSDIERVVIDGFALPLGFVPGDMDKLPVPTPGYTLDYVVGEDDEPDTYSFYVVTSHEQLARLIERVFELLPDEVHGIVEIGSRDAYRSLDVYLAEETIRIEEFLDGWHRFESFLLEDGSIGSGANSEEPFVEVFLDQWKGLSIHIPVGLREEVEAILASFSLGEVAQTWPALDDDAANEALRVRPVLAEEDAYSPGVDEMLLQLREAWRLELNIDREANLDDSGRELGHTLWHAMVIVCSAGRPTMEAYASVWATVDSLAGMEELVEAAIETLSGWELVTIYTIDRIAFDERPEELADLEPRRRRTEVHLVVLES
ncbi:MAG: hypothetical protein GY715_01970 [Planctomycetes bacterium]|nr:hypothetical protein [Planctomycetota bacterium]